MIYILVQGASANVFGVLECALLFQYLQGGDLYSVETHYTAID
jgi:hypothetical protein